MNPDDELLRPLSPREAEVAGWLGRGLAQKQIAAQCQCSERTVEAHIAAIGAKLVIQECVCPAGECTCPAPRRRVMVWAIVRRFWRQVWTEHQQGAA